MSAPADAARSIAAVLAKFNLSEVHLVGHSYGGWPARHAAAETPHRFATLTLVDPAAWVLSNPPAGSRRQNRTRPGPPVGLGDLLAN
ncbi:alpha/beta fold hydrolase [Mycolicibacterium iranicum]|uniref:alpha/beta fold hydrolase n=1 Tax=Mycolicibacterium iranicum TaxID=912594 RepID=UPI0009EF6A70|nr:alpha/beta fold hydrolase [Mycolicibacterium iranicum]